MVFGFIGIFIGIAVGLAGGIWAGTRLFAKQFGFADVSRFDIRADYDEKVPVPVSSSEQPVPAKYRQFLQYFPNWATTPDFYRVTWMNHVLSTLWPSYNQAIGKMVLETAEPYISDITKQYPFIEAIDIELIDFGTKPMRVGGVKVYYSQDDEVIMESPLTWGSNATVRASARIKISKWSFYIPVELSDFQMKVLSRITLRPLVDTLPCMGAVTISLVETPYIDFSLHLFKKFDLMLLPGVSQVANYFIQLVIGDMLQYPNKMTFDIMENGGVNPPPIGLLQVKILKVEHITAGGDLLSKVDPYVDLAVRDRKQRTKTIWNTKNPDFNEVFNLIVDDLNTQVLTLQLHDDDMGFNDPVIGIIEQDLADAEFTKTPRKKVPMTLEFISAPALKKMKRLVKKQSEREDKKKGDDKPQELESTGVDEQGRKQYKIPDAPKAMEKEHGAEKTKKSITAKLHCEITYVPFKDADTTAQEGHKDGAMSSAQAEQKLGGSFSKITDDDKGILTVTLTGCKNLEAADGGVDPYVVFQLDDPKKVKPEIQASSHMTNEPAPHWNTKFDFALISATSTLRLHVYDKKSTMQNVMSHPVKMLTGKVTGKPSNADEMIGALKINIADVVRNDRLRDTFALQETQKGDIQLTLDWHPIEVGDMSSLEQTGDQKEVQRFKKQQEEDKQREEAGDRPAHEKKHKHHMHMPFTHKGEDDQVEKSGDSKRHGLQHLNPFHHSKDKEEHNGDSTGGKGARYSTDGGKSPRGTVEKSGKSGLHMPGFLKSSVAYEEH